MSYPETPEAAALALMREIMRRDPEDAKRTNLSQRTYILQLYAECYSLINGRFKDDVMDRFLH